MTLENKYKEIMNHVQVDEAMRARILENLKAEASGNLVAKAEVSSIEADVKAREKGRRRAMIMKIVPAVAAAVAVLIGGVILLNMNDDNDDKYTEKTDRDRNSYAHNLSEAAFEEGIDQEVDSYLGWEETEAEAEEFEIDSRDETIAPAVNGTTGAINGYTLLTYVDGADLYTSIDSALIYDLLNYIEDAKTLPSSTNGIDDFAYFFVLSGEDNCDECAIGFSEGYIWIDGIFYEYPNAISYGIYLASQVTGTDVTDR